MAIATKEVLELEGANSLDKTGAVALSPGELTDIVRDFAATDGWMERVRLRVAERWYERLYLGPDYDLWVISWMPGQGTGFHDHGDSAGAFAVVTGVLEEHHPGAQVITGFPGTFVSGETRSLGPGATRAFGPGYAHDVRNVSAGPAVSVHAYSPPLSEMNEYELEGELLVPREEASERAETLQRESWRGREGRRSEDPLRGVALRSGVSSIDQVLQHARQHLHRLSAEEAATALTEGAVLVDIRPERQRAAEGSVADAVVVERNVLEWRFDPQSDARLPFVTGHDLQVIVICSEGYTSSLAAAALQDLGLWRATDIVGGFRAWSAAGLPVRSL